MIIAEKLYDLIREDGLLRAATKRGTTLLCSVKAQASCKR